MFLSNKICLKNFLNFSMTYIGKYNLKENKKRKKGTHIAGNEGEGESASMILISLDGNQCLLTDLGKS